MSSVYERPLSSHLWDSKLRNWQKLKFRPEPVMVWKNVKPMTKATTGSNREQVVIAESASLTPQTWNQASGLDFSDKDPEVCFALYVCNDVWKDTGPLTPPTPHCRSPLSFGVRNKSLTIPVHRKSSVGTCLRRTDWVMWVEDEALTSGVSVVLLEIWRLCSVRQEWTIRPRGIWFKTDLHAM